MEEGRGIEHGNVHREAYCLLICIVILFNYHVVVFWFVRSFVLCRVPSEENIADLPSREEYTLMKKLGPWLEPILDDVFREPQSWAALSLRR